MRVIFLGSGEFSLTVLRAIDNSSHEVVAVVAQPDKVNSRGGKVIFSPVKSYAIERGLRLYQFECINAEVDTLKSIGADIMLTASYGQMLSREVLEVCPNGIINTHASLLPKYRGASPIQMALLSGDSTVGTTIMRTVYEMDEGDIVLQKSVELTGEENSEDCFGILAELSAKAAVEALDLIESGKATFIPQDHTKASYCRKLTKEDGKMDFTLSAVELLNRVRAFYGFPSTYCDTPFGRLKVHKARVVEAPKNGAPGEVLVADMSGLIVACGGGSAMEFLTVQGEGARAMSARDYLLGRKLAVGTVLC